MKNIVALCLLLGCVPAAWAGGYAYTIRSTELKAKPYSDAQTLATLAPRSKVEVLARQSGWTQVKSVSFSGWVKMLSLQLESGAQGKRGDSGLGSLFNVAATGKSGSTVTTGVRGLSEEQLKNAQPDAKALQAAKRNAVTPEAAKQFATQGKLEAQSVDYLSGGQ